MKAVFKTSKDSAKGVEIPEIGWAGPKGDGYIEVEKAALRMPELQDEEGNPLEGSKLASAAKEWAAQRGLEVANVKNEQVEDSEPLEVEEQKVAALEAAKPKAAEATAGEEK